MATGISRSDFTSQTARLHLAALGFEVVGGIPARPSEAVPVTASPAPGVTSDDGHGWPWEGYVQVSVRQVSRSAGMDGDRDAAHCQQGPWRGSDGEEGRPPARRRGQGLAERGLRRPAPGLGDEAEPTQHAGVCLVQPGRDEGADAVGQPPRPRVAGRPLGLPALPGPRLPYTDRAGGGEGPRGLRDCWRLP